jgi:hypothetical protein
LKTPKHIPIGILVATAVFVGAALVAIQPPAIAALGDSQPNSGQSPPINSQGKPMSDEEIHARADKLLANQHRDDEAIEQYERVERQVDRTGGASPRTLEDRTYRIVPTGAGNQKILLSEGGKPVDPSIYRQEMRTLAEALQLMANPNDPKAKAAYAKREKREHDRADFVDAAKEAFVIKWLGSATINGRACDALALDPNPNFHPRSMFQAALAHVIAKIWIDRETNQLAHGEAQVTSDVSFGGGILGKLYRGGTVSMDQAEIAAGIWLPIRYQYDFSGRKFLFTFEQHQFIDATHYRRIGPPKDALVLVQSELSSGKTFLQDP